MISEFRNIKDKDSFMLFSSYPALGFLLLRQGWLTGHRDFALIEGGPVDRVRGLMDCFARLAIVSGQVDCGARQVRRQLARRWFPVFVCHCRRVVLSK